MKIRRFLSNKAQRMAAVAAVAATASGALAGGGGVTIPNLGVDAQGFVTALTAQIGPTLGAAAGLGFAVFGVIFAVRKIKQLVK